MPFQLSPGVNVSEIDLTTVVPSVSTTTGAYVGPFQWGPANKRIQIASETQLNQTFQSPDSNTYTSYFTAASFLAYASDLRVVRSVGANGKNSSSNTSTVQVRNEDDFEATYLYSNNANTYGPFMARYTGDIGNSLTVSVLDAGAAAQFSTWNVATSAGNISVSNYFQGPPGTSAQATSLGSSNDQIHVIVMDVGGLFTGTKNTVLEVWPYLSKGSDAKDSLGNSAYYKQVLFKNSKYVYAVDPISYSTTVGTWGNALSSATSFTTVANPMTYNLANGVDDMPSNAVIANSWGYFANADEVDISLAITGDANTTIQQWVIDNIATVRKDCVVFVSPPSTAVINQAGNEVTNITTWYNTLARSSSYAVSDCGWKYMFDKYNNLYRWVPLNGDIAGLCVYTDSVRDAWWSPAGYNRGNLKNVVKLAWNPNKTQRDSLYSIGINPVGTFPGQGTVLFGDKTLQSQPSAFDRINVRRLFIVLEKAIARAAKYALFEFNDDFTRAQFVALVTPFLRDIQGRRGITDFRVVCDSTNNTQQVIDSNQFVGDIYIKPARSINFIQLNFVAVRTGVSFSEVVGQY
jgi:phage tail sheath protein FI